MAVQRRDLSPAAALRAVRHEMFIALANLKNTSERERFNLSRSLNLDVRSVIGILRLRRFQAFHILLLDLLVLLCATARLFKQSFVVD